MGCCRWPSSSCPGWLSCRIGLLKHDDAGVLASLVIRFALPLALFEGAVKISPDKLENLGMAACLTLGLMGSYVIALAIGRFGFKHDLRTAHHAGAGPRLSRH